MHVFQKVFSLWVLRVPGKLCSRGQWQVGREASGLARAVVTLDGWHRAAQAGDATGGGAIVSLTTVAWLIARAALDRCESRGGHARSDFPTRDDLHFKVHVTESIHDQDS